MSWIQRAFLIAATFVAVSQLAEQATAQEPGWASDILVRGQVRQRVEATPMVDRPYRPLHFYGNTVRRAYYRGTWVPAPRDFRSGIQVAVRRPYVPVDQYVGGGR